MFGWGKKKIEYRPYMLAFRCLSCCEGFSKYVMNTRGDIAYTREVCPFCGEKDLEPRVGRGVYEVGCHGSTYLRFDLKES